MARGTSRQNREGRGRAKPSGATGAATGRKRATRAPIIDVTATEIPNRADAPKHPKPENAGRFMDNINSTVFGPMGTWFSQTFDRLLLRPRWMLAVTGGVLALILIVMLMFWPSTGVAPSKSAKDIQAAAQQRFVRLESDIARLIRDVAALPSTMRLEMSRGLAAQREEINRQTGRVETIARDISAVGQRIGKAEAVAKLPNPEIASQLRAIAAGLDGVRRQMAQLKSRSDQFDNAVRTIEQKLVALEALGERLSTAPKSQARGLSKVSIRQIRNAGRALIDVASTSHTFDKPLGVYGALARGDPAISLLSSYARLGVPTMEQLLQRARTFSRPETVAARNGDGPTGFVGRIVTWSEKFVRVRRKIDERKMRTSDWGKLVHALGARGLENGLRLAMAMPRGPALGRWIKDAEARLLIDRQLKLLKGRLDGLKAGSTR